jgi:hypothetical protein
LRIILFAPPRPKNSGHSSHTIEGMTRTDAVLIVAILLVNACASTSASAPSPNDLQAAFVADSIKWASCVTTVESSRIANSAGGDAIVRVMPSFGNYERVLGANVSSEKPKLVAHSSDNGSIQLRIPADSIPESHSIRIVIRGFGWRPDPGTLTIFPGDTVKVEAKLCPQAVLLQTNTVGGPR